MAPRRGWWRRLASAIKDKRSVCLARLTYDLVVSGSGGGGRSSELEVAVIRATSHDDRSVDYKNAGRVFSWARASPSHLHPLVWSLSRRASRTRSWPVALKVLMLAHGLLISGAGAGAGAAPLRLPFDLSEFRDRNSWGFSTFVRAYFEFLDHRSILLLGDGGDDGDLADLRRIDRLQTLLDLLLQIRPCSDGMGVGLVIEAMDCVVVEIFDVYGRICTGVAQFLVAALGRGDSKAAAAWPGSGGDRRKGLLAIAVLRRASEQGERLSAYFDVCRSLGVLNATELPAVERVPDEDIADLEKLVMGGGDGGGGEEEHEGGGGGAEGMQPEEWVVFDDDGDAAGGAAVLGHSGEREGGGALWNNPFASAAPPPVAAPAGRIPVSSPAAPAPAATCQDLIELF